MTMDMQMNERNSDITRNQYEMKCALATLGCEALQLNFWKITFFGNVLRDIKISLQLLLKE